MPVESVDWQSTLPHAQAAELAEEPSDTAHGACLLHRFSDCLQNIPVESADWQSTLPHAQAAELAEEPSDTEQVGGREQVLDDFVHTSPVPDPRMLLEQSTLPHAQAAELAADPSIERQSQYRPAMDPPLTPSNIEPLLAVLSTHAGAQNGA